MPTFIATYDLEDTKPDPHSEFLKQARSNGWNYWILWTEKSIWYRLPNTTLVGTFSNREEAVKSFKKIWSDTTKAGYKINVEKWIVARYEEASWDSDVKQDKK